MGSKQKRVRRSRAEWSEILGRFASSGLSVGEFSRREGIAESSLARWRSRVGESRRSDFVEWTPSRADASSGLSPGEMELSLPGGVRLRFRP